MKKLFVAAAIAAMLPLVTPHAAICRPVTLPSPQAAPATEDASDPKAVQAMQQMLAALGGAKWLAIHNVAIEGRTSGFFEGNPTGAIGDFYSLTTVPGSTEDPGLTRVDFTKKRNVVEILLKNEDWEITYKGKRLVPANEYKAVFRRRDHSLDEAVRVWWHEPGTVLFWGGQKVSERHLVDEITLLDAHNDNITVQMDTDTHLPFRVAFTWRDPLYRDQNVDAEEYADYHPVEGIPTALNLTSYHNDDMTSQKYLRKVTYNVPIPPDAFDVDAATEKIAH
jgi:hypothetical protein